MVGICHNQDPAAMCECHGDDVVAEGSEPLTRLDAIMPLAFEAKLLGRVGRGHLPEIKFLKRSLHWLEGEASFSWSGGTRYVQEPSQLIGFYRRRSADEDESDGQWRMRCVGADELQPSGGLSDRGGHDGLTSSWTGLTARLQKNW